MKCHYLSHRPTQTLLDRFDDRDHRMLFSISLQPESRRGQGREISVSGREMTVQGEIVALLDTQKSEKDSLFITEYHPFSLARIREILTRIDCKIVYGEGERSGFSALT